MADLGAMTVRLKADMSNLSANLKRAGRDIKTFTATVRRQMDRVKRTFRAVGSGIMKFGSLARRHLRRAGIALTAFVVSGVKNLASFQEQMAKVNTMLTRSTQMFLPEFTRAIEQMSVQMGESTQTLTDGLFAVLSASIDAAEAVETLTTITKAAAAGFSDTGTATLTITGIMNAYGKEVMTATRVSDILFATLKRGQTDFQRLAPVIGRVTAEAAPAGIAFEQVGAALATLTRSGLTTELAVTRLAAAIIALMGKEDKAVKIAKEHGIELSINALRTRQLSGTIAVLSELNEETLKDMFRDIRSRSAINILIKKQDEFLRDLGETTNSAGESQKAYVKATDNLNFQLRRLWQTVVAISREAIKPFAEDIKALTKAIADNAEEILVWIELISTNLRNLFLFLKEDPQRAFGVFLDTFVIAMKAAAKVATEMAIRIGQGIWQGLREGLFGADSLAIEREAMRRFKAEGGTTRKVRRPGLFRLATVRGQDTSFKEVAEDTARFLELRTEVANEVIKSKSESIWSDFGTNVERHVDAAKKQFAALADELEGLKDNPLVIVTAAEVRAARAAKRWQEQLAKANEWLGTMPDMVTGLNTAIDAIKSPTDDADKEASAWEKIWSDAANSIASSMETAFADIMEDARNLGEVMTNLARQIQRAVSQAVFNQLLLGPIFEGLSGLGIPLGTGEAQIRTTGQPIPTVTQPMMAQHGAFIPRGSDRIPALLSPGEAVIPEKMMKMFGGMTEPRPVTINVQAIDAAGTYQFLYQNRRAIASMMQETQSQNHPIRRG